MTQISTIVKISPIAGTIANVVIAPQTNNPINEQTSKHICVSNNFATSWYSKSNSYSIKQTYQVYDCMHCNVLFPWIQLQQSDSQCVLKTMQQKFNVN